MLKTYKFYSAEGHVKITRNATIEDRKLFSRSDIEFNFKKLGLAEADYSQG